MVAVFKIVDRNRMRNYLIETVDGPRIEVHSNNLARPKDPDIAVIPLSASDYVRKSRHIIEEQAEHVARPKKLSPLKQCFPSCHKRLNHFPKKNLFQIFDQGILPSEFAQLKADSPLYDYFIYGQAHRKSWRTRGKKLAIRRDIDNAPGKCTSTDQLVSVQPDLNSQIGGHLTATRLWAAYVFVDNFSNLFYVHLLLSTTKEETLNAKADYEHFSNDHGIKVC